MKTLFGLAGLAASAVVAAIFRYFNVRRARERMRLLERGEICIGCDSLDVTVRGNSIVCNRCGLRSSLEAIQSSKLSEADLATMCAPDDRRGNGMLPP